MVFGHLTGDSKHHDLDDGGYRTWVALEIEVARSIKGDFSAGERVYVQVDYGPAARPAIRYGDVGVRGLPVVVFGNLYPDSSHLVAAVEGFATACDGGNPMGRLGKSGAWLALSSLDELIGAAGTPVEASR
ncbi:MAG: hypothetical protein Q8K63_05650 [Acidimicrobiales bacterium]|nr:hypothetical protein [Acidimicrobiales bacterium]